MEGEFATDEFGEGTKDAMSYGFAMARGAGVKCGRWNPTAEQVKVLTDLFRSGLRTPTTDQIQMISSHLSAFGKIESKNVFYWFQNHKARERHHKKRRRVWSPEELEEVVVVEGGGGSGRDTQKTRSRCFTSCMRGELQETMWEQQKADIEANETLELFPLKSYGMEQANKLRPLGGELCKGRALLDAGRDPPLDLRLSFW